MIFKSVSLFFVRDQMFDFHLLQMSEGLFVLVSFKNLLRLTFKFVHFISINMIISAYKMVHLSLLVHENAAILFGKKLQCLFSPVLGDDF